MHLYLNYAREHWTIPGENPPVGLILCSARNEAIVKYSLTGHAAKVLAAEYRTALPDEKLLAERVAQARAALTRRLPDRNGGAHRPRPKYPRRGQGRRRVVSRSAAAPRG
jgi:hypothetical protein